jgi:hypothetical protein
VKVSQEKDILNFKECLGDGNLWFCPSLFIGFVAASSKLKIKFFDLIIFKHFGVCWQGSKRNASLCSIGHELYAEWLILHAGSLL